MNVASPRQKLLRQTAGAVAWAGFFILAPLEILVPGALVWIPLLVWRECVRASRYGFFPGLLLRGAVIAAVVVVAACLPNKGWDRRIPPLAQADVSLEELAAAHVIYPPRDEKLARVRVRLPSTAPTRREVLQAITQQTGLKASPSGLCGNGASILFGASVGPIRVSVPRPNAG